MKLQSAEVMIGQCSAAPYLFDEILQREGTVVDALLLTSLLRFIDESGVVTFSNFINGFFSSSFVYVGIMCEIGKLLVLEDVLKKLCESNKFKCVELRLRSKICNSYIKA